MRENLYIQSMDDFFFKATSVKYYNIEFTSGSAEFNCFIEGIGKKSLDSFYCESEAVARIVVSMFMEKMMKWLKEKDYISSTDISLELYKTLKRYENLGK